MSENLETQEVEKAGAGAPSASILGLATPFAKAILDSLITAREDRKSYTQKLEAAKGDDVFKYLLLINTYALEEYVAQTRLQAEQSFRLSKIVSIVGFGLLIVGIAVGIYSNLSGIKILDAAYLASIAGILTEFISGVFFYLYNRTLQQLNLFHDKIITSQRVATSLLANSLIESEIRRDESKVDISKKLMSFTIKGEQV